MLSVQNLSYQYNKTKVLDNINLDISPGEITYLIGLNGSGKTTLMNLIMQLMPIQSGCILLNHQEIQTKDLERIAYIPDQIIVLKNMTIQDALDSLSCYYQCFNPQRASQLLDYFKLNRTSKISSLSKGNVAKVNLLLGLSLDTDYLLMDEPFSGIDALSREHLVQVFNSKLIEDRGVLISSHEVQEIEHLVDKAVLLKDGKIISEFSPEEMRYQEGKAIIDVMRGVY